MLGSILKLIPFLDKIASIFRQWQAESAGRAKQKAEDFEKQKEAEHDARQTRFDFDTDDADRLRKRFQRD